MLVGGDFLFGAGNRSDAWTGGRVNGSAAGAGDKEVPAELAEVEERIGFGGSNLELRITSARSRGDRC